MDIDKDLESLVLEAIEYAEKCGKKPTHIIINSKHYKPVKVKAGHILTLFDLKCEYAELDDSINFYLTEGKQDDAV